MPDTGQQPRGRGRPRRSFERIVATAFDLADEVGTTAFSMRSLAERLDTSTATLYRHVAGKDELMAHVLDRVLGEIQPPHHLGKGGGTWQDEARHIALAFHRALSRHPNVLPLLVSQVPVGPNAMALRERTIATFVRSGFSVPLAARAYTTLAHYVIGFAVQEHARGAPGPREAGALRDYFRRLDADRYQFTIAAADDLTAVPLEDEFREGLDFILDGIDSAYRRRRAARGKRG